MKKRIILTDIDGVVLNWEDSFNQWMQSMGMHIYDKDAYHIHVRFGIDKADSKKLVRQFNESAKIAYLKPFRDSVYYIKRFHEEHGFVFHSITSLSSDPSAQKLRIQNLKSIFGEHVFERFLFEDTGNDKDAVLAEYANTGYAWIEDKPANAEAGLAIGLTSFLMHHVYNEEYRNARIKRVTSWAQIYNSFYIS